MPDSSRDGAALTVPAAPAPDRASPRPATRPGFRVIAHEPVCPACGSFDVTSDEVDTGDGLTETALICQSCGCAWPLACVCEWS